MKLCNVSYVYSISHELSGHASIAKVYLHCRIKHELRFSDAFPWHNAERQNFTQTVADYYLITWQEQCHDSFLYFRKEGSVSILYILNQQKLGKENYSACCHIIRFILLLTTCQSTRPILHIVFRVLRF